MQEKKKIVINDYDFRKLQVKFKDKKITVEEIKKYLSK